MVVLTRWSGRDVEALIDVELRRLEAFGAPVDWQLFAGAQQVELAAGLARRGLAAASNLWLIAELAALPAPPAIPPELCVALAETPSQMDAWRRGLRRAHAMAARGT